MAHQVADRTVQRGEDVYDTSEGDAMLLYVAYDIVRSYPNCFPYRIRSPYSTFVLTCAVTLQAHQVIKLASEMN